MTTTTYNARLQASLHDAPNPLDPVGATDWGATRASEFTPVEVSLVGGELRWQEVFTMISQRPVGVGGVWALFTDRWGAAVPLCWAALAGTIGTGEPVDVEPGFQRLTVASTFAVRNAGIQRAGNRS